MGDCAGRRTKGPCSHRPSPQGPTGPQCACSEAGLALWSRQGRGPFLRGAGRYLRLRGPVFFCPTPSTQPSRLRAGNGQEMCWLPIKLYSQRQVGPSGRSAKPWEMHGAGRGLSSCRVQRLPGRGCQGAASPHFCCVAMSLGDFFVAVKYMYHNVHFTT